MIQNVVRSVLLLPLLIVRCFLPNVIKINHVLGRFVGPNVPGDATKFLSILGNRCFKECNFVRRPLLQNRGSPDGTLQVRQSRHVLQRQRLLIRMLLQYFYYCSATVIGRAVAGAMACGGGCALLSHDGISVRTETLQWMQHHVTRQANVFFGHFVRLPAYCYC